MYKIVPDGRIRDIDGLIIKMNPRKYRSFFGKAKEVIVVYCDDRRMIVKLGKKIKVYPTAMVFFNAEKLVEIIEKAVRCG